MFAEVVAAITRGLAPLREHTPAALDLLRRYVEAQEKHADAMELLASAVTNEIEGDKPNG